MRVLITSTNPNKIEGAQKAFNELASLIVSNNKKPKFVFEAQKFPSEVSNQPIGFYETITGAYNRAKNARNSHGKEFDFYVGVESGIIFLSHQAYVVSYACVMDNKGKYYIGSSVLHAIPKKVLETITQKLELAHFAEQISGTHDIRSKNGIAGFLFHNKYTRLEGNYLAVKGALVGFIRKEIFDRPIDFKVIKPNVYISAPITVGTIKEIPLKLTEIVEKTGGIVNNKHVIYAGHDHGKRDDYLRKYAKEHFNLDLPEFHTLEFAHFIYKLDTHLVDNATHLIAILDKPSFGIAMEIQHALTKQQRGLFPTKILGLIRKQNKPNLSKMIIGAAVEYKNFEILPYESIEGIAEEIKNFLHF